MFWSGASEAPRERPYDDWGWVYVAPLLTFQLLCFVAVVRANTIRFQQLLLSLCGIYWACVVYFVQYFPRRTSFCDLYISRCSYCLNEPIAYSLSYFNLVDRGSVFDRSIADTSVLYYVMHISYPLIQKIPVLGYYSTHFGFCVSVVVALCCVSLAYFQVAEVGDICLVNSLLFVINWGLARTMFSHLSHVVAMRQRTKRREE